MKVNLCIYCSGIDVNMYFKLFVSILSASIKNVFFVSAAQEQSSIYPSHSYNTNSSSAPPVTAPKQEDHAGSRTNGTQEHSVVNIPTGTSDTITIHSGKAKKNCRCALTSKSKFVSLSSFTCRF